MSKTILLAEDHLSLQQSLRDWLTSVFPNYDVIAVDNGQDAVESARRVLPTAVIMDINLPKLNGIEATRILRREQPELPIIVLTLYEGEPYRGEAVAAGATVFIPKRCMQTELVPVLNRLIYTEKKHIDTARQSAIIARREEDDQSSPAAGESISRDPVLSLLVVEDNPGDARLVREMLRESVEEQFRIIEAGSLSTAVDCLNEGDIDMVLADLHLPDSAGLETFRGLHREAPRLPIIVLSGLEDEKVAIQALRDGAQDYLLKSELNASLLTRSLRYARERKRSEDSLREGDEMMKKTQEAFYESERRFRAMLENIQLVAVILDKEGAVTFCNPFFLRLTGGRSEDVIGHNWFDLYVPVAKSESLKQQYLNGIATGEIPTHREFEIRCPGGEDRLISWSQAVLRDLQGRIVGVTSIGEDIVERRATEERIRQLAYYDVLTGLPNRTLFSDRIILAIAAAKRKGAHLAMLMLDLDKFKDVNDTLGHNTGDQLLIQVGERLRKNVRESDTVARFGGDEFIVLLSEVNLDEDVDAIAAKIIQTFQLPFDVENHQLSITTSIGVAIYPGHGEDEGSLLKHADTAMYRAKGKGRNTYDIFNG